MQAPPGAGKTTVVPLALRNENWLARRKILVLEPRRMATRAAAARMAQLLEEPVGRTVGYRMRLESCVSDETRIEVVTEGILTRQLQRDPGLEDVGLVVFDEFHERNLDSDLCLALCLQGRRLYRDKPDLKLLVMSATLDGEAGGGPAGRRTPHYLGGAPVSDRNTVRRALPVAQLGYSACSQHDSSRPGRTRGKHTGFSSGATGDHSRGAGDFCRVGFSRRREYRDRSALRWHEPGTSSRRQCNHRHPVGAR